MEQFLPGSYQTYKRQKIDPETVWISDLIPGLAKHDFEFAFGLMLSNLAHAGTFRGAEEEFKVALPFVNQLTPEQAVSLLRTSIQNGQVLHAKLCASQYLPTIHASQLGSAVTGTMLSMGLGFRLRHTRKALAEKQIEEALTQSRHERERRELIEEHNRGLEAKVVERTAELVASQQQSDALLANILPKAIIAELKANGVSEPRRHEETSILFTDFSGFTQAVSTIPAKRLVQELDEIFRGFDDIVTSHGLEKIKTIGDAYMIASGLPDASADHAVRCVRAGLALTRFIEERNQTAAMKWGLRVGVHSGAVVAGIVGKNKYVYDVWGDTVNIANRMESGGEVNKVNISAYTYDLVRDHFDCEYRGKMAAKGKGEIDMYFVLRERVAVDGGTSNIVKPHDP